jgi:hypothetical protein
MNMTFRCLPLVWIAFWLSGCQSANELPGLGSDARQYEGQMIYKTSSRSIVGDVILRTRANGDYDLVFSKTGVLVLQLQVHGNEFSASGPVVRPGYTGPIELAQGELRNWAHLKTVLPYFYSNDPNASGRGWTATFDRQGNRLTGSKIEFIGRKASMVFSFS